MTFPDLTITSLETITAFDVVTGEYKFTLDELQSASIAQTQDKVDMTGKGGRKLNSLKRNKAVTISGADGMVSGGLLEMQTGGQFNDGIVIQVYEPEFTMINKAQIVNGEIDVSNSYTTNIIYAECEPNTTYHIGPAPGYILTFNIGWTKTTPADGVSVYGYTDRESDSSRKTITTGSDAEYLFVEMAYGATSAYVKVEKENDVGFEIMWNDYLTVSTGPQHMYCTMNYKAVGTAGSEITSLHVRRDDGTLSAPFTQVASNGQLDHLKFVYDKSHDWLLFYEDDVSEGEEIVVFYNRRVHADQLINYSDFFSGKCALYIDALAEDKCANIYRVQFFIPKADFNGEFSFDMGDNQTIHNFEAEALAGACGTAGQLWTYTVFNGEGLIEFTINYNESSYTYQSEAGLTWDEWIASDYNTGPFTFSSDGLNDEVLFEYEDDSGSISYYDGSVNDDVLGSDEIVDGRMYDAFSADEMSTQG